MSVDMDDDGIDLVTQELSELLSTASATVMFDRGANIRHACTFCGKGASSDGNKLFIIGRYGNGQPIRRPVCDSEDCQRIAAIREQQVSPRVCKHPVTLRGAEIPRRYGSYRTQICTECHAFRRMTHYDDPVGDWLPKEQYDAAIAESEDT